MTDEELAVQLVAAGLSAKIWRMPLPTAPTSAADFDRHNRQLARTLYGLYQLTLAEIRATSAPHNDA